MLRRSFINGEEGVLHRLSDGALLWEYDDYARRRAQMNSQVPSRSIPEAPALFTPRLAATTVDGDVDGDGDGDCTPPPPPPPTPAVDAVDVRRALVTAVPSLATNPGAVMADGSVTDAVMLVNWLSASAVSVA